MLTLLLALAAPVAAWTNEWPDRDSSAYLNVVKAPNTGAAPPTTQSGAWARRRLDHDSGSGSGESGSGSGDYPSCNPCGCKSLPQEYVNAGVTTDNGYMVWLPPADGSTWTASFSAGCYVSGGEGPPTFGSTCSNATLCLNNYCQTTFGEGAFYMPTVDFTQWTGYDATAGICIAWHWGSNPGLSANPYDLGKADCPCSSSTFASSTIPFGSGPKMHCQYEYNGNGQFNMQNTHCSFSDY